MKNDLKYFGKVYAANVISGVAVASGAMIVMKLVGPSVIRSLLKSINK